MTIENLTQKFTGKPLVNTPRVDYLGEDLGEYIHKEIVREYKDFPVVSNNVYYDKESKLVTGSKPFYNVAVNEFLRDSALHTATPAELELTLSANAKDNSLGLNLRGTYEDSALALRSETALNEYLAKNIIAQLKARNPKIKMPLMIPLTGFDLEKDQNSPHGLAFKLRDEAEIIYAPILISDSGYFNSEDIDLSIGLPKKLQKKGSRYFYTKKEGLSRLYLGRYLYLDSYDVYLADSDVGGRVVVVSGEAAGFDFAQQLKEQQKANFEALRKSIDELYSKRKSDLESRFVNAKKLLEEN